MKLKCNYSLLAPSGWRNHPSVVCVTSCSNNRQLFMFKHTGNFFMATYDYVDVENEKEVTLTPQEAREFVLFQLRQR